MQSVMVSGPRVLDPEWSLERFEGHLGDLAGDFSRDALVSDRFLLWTDGPLAEYYAPFDYVNASARLALVGVTPGWTQMRIAYCVFATRRAAGAAPSSAFQAAKTEASFAGSMRTNLTKMLDALDVADAVGAHGAADLFAAQRSLIHTTSAVRYPVFKGGRNYTGHGPSIVRHPVLATCVDKLLGPELEAIPGALVVPLGDAVQSALERLVAKGTLEIARCLMGFPHPSGANGHRARHFADRLPDLRAKVKEWSSQ